MKSLTNILRATFISLEFFCIVVAVFLSLWQPGPLASLAKRVAGNGALIQYFALAPVAIFVWVFTHSRRMLFPEADKKSILQGWPDYRMFREIVFVGVGFAVVFLASGVAVWAMDWSRAPTLSFIWTLASIVGAAITAFSMYHAEIVLTEHLTDQNSRC